MTDQQHNVFSGTADTVIQARDIHGDVHIHQHRGHFRRSQLRADIPDFTNRVEEVADLRALVGERPVVCVWGPGGIGKSALVTHLAHELRQSFPYARLHADLRGVDLRPADPAEVLGRLLLALGVPAKDIPHDPEARADMFRSALSDRAALLVLDNAYSEAQVRTGTITEA
jgi:hypothetical protein